MADIYCISVIVQPEGVEIMIVLEENLSPENLMEQILSGLEDEYREINDVTGWCFHFDSEKPFPGDFEACRDCRPQEWLLEHAAEAFGWGQ